MSRHVLTVASCSKVCCIVFVLAGSAAVRQVLQVWPAGALEQGVPQQPSGAGREVRDVRPVVLQLVLC